MIPAFSIHLNFLPEQARQDRIELSFDAGVLEGVVDQIDGCRKALAPRDDAEDFTECGMVFTQPVQHESYRKPQTVRRKPGKLNQRVPLFAGALRFTQYDRLQGACLSKSRLFFDLNANATTFNRYDGPEEGEEPILDVPFSYPLSPDGADEFSLDGKVNYIRQGAQDEFYSPTRWQQSLKRHFEMILETVRGEVANAASLAGCYWTCGPPNWSVKKVETYFEAFCDSPVDTVLSLRQALADYCPIIRESAFQNEVVFEGNSIALRFLIRRGVELVIYAKTNKRIRFEVRHDLKEVRKAKPMKADKLDPLIGKDGLFDSLRVEAAKIVNGTLTHARKAGLQPQASPITPDLLLLKIGAVTRNFSFAALIAGGLKSRGAVAPQDGNESFKNALRRLKDKGVLQWNGSLYVPTPEYATAVLLMRNQPPYSIPSQSPVPLPKFPKRSLTAAPVKEPSPPPATPKRRRRNRFDEAMDCISLKDRPRR